MPPPASRDDGRWEMAWTWLHERYKSAMRRYVYQLLRQGLGRAANLEDAYDIVGDYVQRAIDEGDLSGDDILSFRAYLMDQLYKRTMDWLRKQGAKKRGGHMRRAEAFPEDRIPAPGDDPAARAMEKGIMTIAIHAALERLEQSHPMDAAILRLVIAHFGEERVNAKIAEELRLEPATVSVRKNRARHRFATKLQRELKLMVADPEALREEWRVLGFYAPWIWSE